MFGYPEIAAGLDLSSQQFRMRLPIEFPNARFRLTALDSTYYSDAFNISPQPDLDVELNCGNNLTLQWNDTGERYIVQSFLDEELVEVSETTDTLFTVDRGIYVSPLYRVIPLNTQGDRLIPSFLINADQQNVGCYIQSFIVRLVENQAMLNIKLSGISLIKEVKVFKSENGNPFRLLNNLAGLEEQEVIDENPAEGVTRYKVQVLSNEGQLFEEEVELFQVSSTAFAFPTIITEDFFYLLLPEEKGSMVLLDSQGKEVLHMMELGTFEYIDASNLRDGIYFYETFDEKGTATGSGRVMVR